MIYVNYWVHQNFRVVLNLRFNYVPVLQIKHGFSKED